MFSNSCFVFSWVLHRGGLMGWFHQVSHLWGKKASHCCFLKLFHRKHPGCCADDWMKQSQTRLLILLLIINGCISKSSNTSTWTSLNELGQLHTFINMIVILKGTQAIFFNISSLITFKTADSTQSNLRLPLTVLELMVINKSKRLPGRKAGLTSKQE